MKEWIKDKTYYKKKYHRKKIEYKIMESTYERELKQKMFQIAELQDEVEYYKEKNRQYRKSLNEKKEKIRELEK